MKKLYLLFVMVCMLVSLTACSSSRPEAETTVEETIPLTVCNMDDVVEDGFYVCRAETYEMLYIKNANFNITERPDSTGDGWRTLWYNDDWTNVPTMYAGDMLVYKTSNVLNEEFLLERFAYVGYTIGVSGLTQTVSGRYALSLEAENMTINPASDAMQLYEIPTIRVIIDRLGGSPLRSGNITSAGLVLGLAKGGKYLAEVYQGTFLKEVILTADSIALTSMESATTVDYDFLQSQIISIHFPEHYNSGYYLINGYGIVRYVNGVAYDEFTDFNIPNVLPEGTEEPSTEAAETDENGETVESSSVPVGEDFTTSVKIEKQGLYQISVKYDATENETPPTVILFNHMSAYPFSRTAVDTVSRTLILNSDEYGLQVIGLDGRSCEIEVVAVEDGTEPDSTAAETENETETAAEESSYGG